mgnify:CR=1 FL=1
MTRAETKVQRLLQIEALLLNHPEGLTQSEIARRLDVNRSTVYRNLPDLTLNAPIFEEDGRLFIDRKSYLVNLKLNLYEALSLHLATRLLTNRIERHNPHTASLLRKLSQTIEKLTPQISQHLSLSADVADDPSRFQDPHYISVLETLALAWAEGRVVEVWHRNKDTNQVYKYSYSVYFIEPYAVGYAIHVIGLREPPREIRTFNLARIERVEVTDDYYQIPEDFDPTMLLQQAWGIWYTDKKPEEVQLRFSPRVAERVLETRWHPTQQTQKQADGSLMWSAKIAEPKEMVPWIRGWGVDCEVVAPVNLRNKLINEIAAMQRLYIQSDGPLYMALWAKYNPGDELDWHPLMWHLLDTAAVTKLLWQGCLSEEYKRNLAKSFSLSIDNMGRLLMFWVGAHDIGKAGPEFQKKNPARQQALQRLGFVFPSSRFKVEGFHATATTMILKQLFASNDSNMPRSFRMDLAKTLGGHHGEFPDDQILNKALTEKLHVGDERWRQAQEQIFFKMAEFLHVPVPQDYPNDISETNSILMLIAGLATTADWIASNQEFFPFLNADLTLNEYFSIAQKQAKNALTTLGWYGWKSSGDFATFGDLFPEFSPNQIQQAVIDNLPNFQSPFLAIIEAPTGSGKTEAALYLADSVTQRDEKAGIYIAMPTQATSNQMYNRTANFLAHRYSEDQINLHLVHGAALLNERDRQFEPTSVWGEDPPEYSNIHSHGWFLPRKKTLLAPFGVGTVDQTFLSVLKSRHFFLRLFGLSHKVLIFDEVHAYDVYMTRIFKTLLHWLHAVGTSVIILSATLPLSTRLELLKAYGGNPIDMKVVEYSRISTVSEDGTQVIQAGNIPPRKIQLGWIDKKPESITAALEEHLVNGGCAAVICNRINRAQEVYDVVRDRFDTESTEIILFHSRFPYAWRKQIEDRVLSMFGKHAPNRPKRAIIIATQVIEQSLDLDFDLLITDLAPVDLLIQRIGRLHRHADSQPSPPRPKGLKKPICIISAPEPSTNNAPIEFDSDAFIYEPYILLRTLMVLGKYQTIELPQLTDTLIENVYSFDKPPSFSNAIWQQLQKYREILVKHQAESENNADNYLIPFSNISFLGSLKSSLSDDIQGLSKRVIKAPTREISPSVQIVCLTKENDGIHPLGDPHIIDLGGPLTREQIRSCLRASVTLNHYRVLNFFLNNLDEVPECFKMYAALQWHFPVVFEDFEFRTNDFMLTLDKNRGIQVKSI